MNQVVQKFMKQTLLVECMALKSEIQINKINILIFKIDK
jgi:hypothetical protein